VTDQSGLNGTYLNYHHGAADGSAPGGGDPVPAGTTDRVLLVQPGDVYLDCSYNLGAKNTVPVKVQASDPNGYYRPLTLAALRQPCRRPTSRLASCRSPRSVSIPTLTMAAARSGSRSAHSIGPCSPIRACRRVTPSRPSGSRRRASTWPLGTVFGKGEGPETRSPGRNPAAFLVLTMPRAWQPLLWITGDLAVSHSPRDSVVASSR
jgi:hypothetical protein